MELAEEDDGEMIAIKLWLRIEDVKKLKGRRSKLIGSYSVKPRSGFLISCFTFAVQENTKTTKQLSFLST